MDQGELPTPNQGLHSGWAGIQPSEVKNEAVPEVVAASEVMAQPKKKGKGIWKLLLSLLLIVGLGLAVVEYQQGNIRIPYRLPLVELNTDTEDKTPVEEYVEKSGETAEVIRQLENTCLAQNEEGNSCVTFSFDRETRACSAERVSPCCGNGLCELTEETVCTQDCLQIVGGNSVGVLSLKYLAEKKGFTKLAQTFTVDEPMTLRSVSPLIEFRVGSGIGTLEVWEVSNPAIPNEGTLLQTVKFEIEKLRTGTSVEMVFNPPIALDRGKTYSVVIAHSQFDAAVGMGASDVGVDELPGEGWLYSPLTNDENGYFSEWQRLDRDLALTFVLVKRAVTPTPTVPPEVSVTP